jgi:hypothetical protein
VGGKRIDDFSFWYFADDFHGTHFKEVFINQNLQL